MLAIVLASALVQHLVLGAEAQLTVDENTCDLYTALAVYREDIDQLYKCRANLTALTAIARDALQRKNDCIKDVLFEGNCTLSEDRKVCFERENLIPFGSERASEFNDIDEFPVNNIQNVFVTGFTLYIRRWGSHVIIGAIEVTYNSSSAIFQHGTQCKDNQANGTARFRLEPGDRITSISAKAGMMIDQLTFTTKNGRTYGPYGSSGGGTVRLNPQKPNGYLAYVEGYVTTTLNCRSIRVINFVWGYA